MLPHLAHLAHLPHGIREDSRGEEKFNICFQIELVGVTSLTLHPQLILCRQCTVF